MNPDITLKMIGKKFNRLTVLEFSHKRQYRSYWKCKCDCGKEITVERHHLVGGYTKSCGCFKVYKRASGESGLKLFIKGYKSNAIIRGMKFNLTMEDVRNITSKNCYYCGEEPSGISIMSKSKDEKLTEYRTYKYSGIDRIDSNKGYELDNVVPCCKWCNIAKNDSTVDEFKNHIFKMYNFLKTNGWPI